VELHLDSFLTSALDGGEWSRFSLVMPMKYRYGHNVLNNSRVQAYNSLKALHNNSDDMSRSTEITA